MSENPDIAALVAELERVRAENDELRRALAYVIDNTSAGYSRGAIRPPVRPLNLVSEIVQ